MATTTMDPSHAAIALRRATYVNVDKLVRSQYDIDLQLLTDELVKLKAVSSNEEHENAAVDAKDGDNSSPGGERGAGSSSAGTTKPNAWSGTNLSVLPGGPLRAPLPGKYHQSRLQPPRNGFNLCLLVGKVKTVVDKFRVDGSRVLVAEVEVGDETGSISLRARDEQIDKLREVSNAGGAIVLRNCTMELYQGKHLRLAVSKWGKMSAYPDGIESTPNPPSSMYQELNFSLVDLNIVATTKMPTEPPFPMTVATVHHKHKPHQQQQHTPKHLEESPRGTRNRSRSQGGHYVHEKKKKDNWQYHRQHQQQQQQSRPRSGSHMSGGPAGGQYLLQNQQSGGPTSPPQNFAVPQQMHYQQQYSDAGSVYSYPSQQQDQQGGSPHRQYQGQGLPNDHYMRQNAILYQQYEMQQAHAHQMQLLQHQQQSQMKLLQEQHRDQQIANSALIPDLNRVESHESGGGGEYSIHTQVGAMVGSGPTMQPNPPPPQPMAPPLQPHPGMNSEYPQYGSLMPSPMGNTFQGGEGQQPPRGSMGGMQTYATVISPPPPPMSPAHTSHPAPQAPPQYPDGRLDGQYDTEHQE